MPTGLLLQSIGLLIVIFLVLAFFLRRILRGHTEMAVKRLQKLNEDNLRREMELKRKLDEAERSYKSKLESAEQVGLKIKETSQKEAQAIRDRITSRANDEREEIIAEAKDDAEAIRTSVRQQMELNMLDKAVQLLKSTLPEELTTALHNQFIEQVTKELSSLSLSNIEMSNKTIEVISPQPLTQEHKKRLTEILSSKIGRKITLTEKSDAENRHIAGLYIKIGDFVVDGTFYNKLQRQVSLLKEDIKTKL